MKASEISGKKVLVIGTGLSGVGSVRLLHQVGAVPVMLEENTKVTKEDMLATGERIESSDGFNKVKVIGKAHLAKGGNTNAK